MPPRRRLVLGLGAAAFVAAAQAQGGRALAANRSITVVQVVDTSPQQQDVSKDFLIGSRAAWQEVNSKGGLHGRPVQHVSIETDGSAAGVQSAIAAVRENAGIVVLSGTAGDPLATALLRALRDQGIPIAHVAPWLQNSSIEVDDRTFPIFAARQEQMGHALKSLSALNVHEIGAVHASEREYREYHQDLLRTAAELKLKLQTFRADGELVRLGQQLSGETPAILLFIGGTPELVQLTQGMEKQTRLRFIVALADINLQTLVQMGAGRNTPVIATQPVPLVNANLPVVRAYRDALGRFFDEPPTPLSLAGYIAARYTFEVLSEAGAGVTRQSALAAFQRRSTLDVGGFRVAYDPRRRGGVYVTQSMLTLDGRVVG